ncbi:MAG: DUF2442 domain-containing protein [Kiritimatiellales bacterium]|nr:DUF2442 domain-containing protein [Kiritimatiellota bacterium]MBL7011873.1 DUF2442 domain-containing protein [Kiritimatiellales bacterium]
MNYDITSAEYLDGYRLTLRFQDGASGIADLKTMIDRGGVFTPLEDVELFKTFSLSPYWNTLTWCDEQIDIAPETLYVAATGREPQREPVLMVAEEPEGYENGTKSDN